MNKKGFTLIEIIAVIIVISILLLIAVPSVSRYIEESRQKAYVATIKDTLVSAGSNLGKIDKKVINKETTYYIPINCVETENGIPKSPYNDFDNAYIVVGWENNNFGLYFYGRDKSGVGVNSPVKISEFEVDDIKKNISKESIVLDKYIGNTYKLMELSKNDCKTVINVIIN